jgi:large subunit ribosomal protein L6
MVKVAFFREELEIPKEVEVKLGEHNEITVKGPEGGPITKNFSHARGINISIEDNKLVFTTNFPRGSTLALVNTIINIIQNLIKGVQENYTYVCKVCYSHFPCSVEAKPNRNELHVVNFLGERAPRVTKYDAENIKVEVKGDDVYLTGPDKEALGQAAANLKRVTRIRKKDPRIFQDGVYLFKKQIGDKILFQIK